MFCTEAVSLLPGLQFASEKETRMGSKATESLRWFDGYSLVIGKSSGWNFHFNR